MTKKAHNKQLLNILHWQIASWQIFNESQISIVRCSLSQGTQGN